jgi:glycerol-3-phosphate acyltransferase PlsY
VHLAALLVVPSYLLGTFPTGLLVGRRHGHDPTAEGSGNPGATNVARVAGRGAGVLVLLGDLLKGAIPAAIGVAVGGVTLGLACGAAAVLGHVAPATRQFRGGKGVATASGMVIVCYPALSLVVGAVFVLTALLTRRVSAASLAMAVALPLILALSGQPGIDVAIAAGVSGCVIARHHANIARLLRGQEPAFTASRPLTRPTRRAP